MTDAATARHIAMLETLTDCVGELAVMAHDLALALKGHPDRFIALSAECRHGAFAARMGVRLIQALKAGPLPMRAASPGATSPAREAARSEPSDRPERPERERESESESEPASLPLFLKTLRDVAADAERRKPELPAEARERTLPNLHALIAELQGPQASPPEPQTAADGVARPPRPPPERSARSTRAKLMGSTLVGGLDLRRDTG